MEVEIVSIPRIDQTYVRRIVDKKNQYLHNDGRWRSTTFNTDGLAPVQSGYFSSRAEAEHALAKDAERSHDTPSDS